jgi:hypothetical protein
MTIFQALGTRLPTDLIESALSVSEQLRFVGQLAVKCLPLVQIVSPLVTTIRTARNSNAKIRPCRPNVSEPVLECPLRH